MTTITTGTSGPKAWKMILAGAAVGLATIAIVNLPQTTSNTTSNPATDASQAVTTESPQSRSFFEENQATATLPESVAGFEYGSESTAGQVVSPGVTTQYPGNSGELFPYENGPMPQPTLNQAEFDRLAPAARTPDSLADAQARASVGTRAEVPALVNPVPEVNAAQLIADIIASERVAPAYSLAAADEALVTGASVESVGVSDVATNARWEALDEEYKNSTAASYVDADPVPVVPGSANTSAGAGTDARWEAVHDAFHDGSLLGYTDRSGDLGTLDIKSLEGRSNDVPQSGRYVYMANHEMQ
jgi:hypothetical protein